MAKFGFNEEEKKQYFAALKQEWMQAKQHSEEEKSYGLAWIAAQEMGVNCSLTGFTFVLRQMVKLELDGLPYQDCKTFKGWQEFGYQVNKGEKSKLFGITWVGPGRVKAEKLCGVIDECNDEQMEKGMIWPKKYVLFHRSQVVKLAEIKAA